MAGICYSADPGCSIGETDDFVLLVYTGGAPWDPQVNLIYKNMEVEFSYEHGREKDNNVYREDSRRLVKKIGLEERNKILAIIEDSNFFSLQEKYVDENIADGTKIIIEVKSGECTKEVRVHNYYVKPVIRMLERMNELAPKDIKLLVPDRRGISTWDEDE
jgi:hypothetical protein